MVLLSNIVIFDDLGLIVFWLLFLDKKRGTAACGGGAV